MSISKAAGSSDWNSFPIEMGLPDPGLVLRLFTGGCLGGQQIRDVALRVDILSELQLHAKSIHSTCKTSPSEKSL
jgi:hypothetical protein